MNQSRTTYQSDYSSYDWFQNNFSSQVNEFCCSENIDDCLKYISQEFSALGYPSIYSSSSDCPFAVNCDIVKLLNAIFELLRSWNGQNHLKEDLESRNQRLSSDLNILNIKNNQLKNSVEQLQKKLASALERERQFKEKNDHLALSLKNEKDETKRLAAQLRQQKVSQQHEYRKYENSLNQIKTKLNQLLTEKTPKKLVNISMSHSLPRNTGQRGKWKTNSTTSSAMEDMYNSVISNYENCSKDTYKEVLLLRHYLQSVLLQTMDVVSLLKGGEDNAEFPPLFEDLVLSIMSNECNELSSFDEKFTHLFTTLKEIASSRSNFSKEALENEIADLKSKVHGYESFFKKLKETHKDDEHLKKILPMNILVDETNKIGPENVLKEEKKKLAEERLALEKSLQILEKEKAEVAAQKFAFLKLGTEQKASSKWQNCTFKGLKTVPSLSIMTSKDGSTAFSNLNHLKASSSNPDSVGMSPPARNNCEVLPTRCSQSKSDTALTLSKTADSVRTSPLEPEFFSSDLPSWVVSQSAGPEAVFSEPITVSEMCENTSTIEIEPVSDISGESIQRLQAAVSDMESMRKNIS